MIMMRNTSAIPIAPALRLVLIASEPSVAPTILERTCLSVRGSAPIRIVVASCSASSYVEILLISALPPVIAL